MGNEQNFCIQWKDKDPKVHLNSSGQPLFGPLRTHPVGEVITLISTQLFLLYARQDHQAARRASLPNSSSNPKILTMKTKLVFKE